MPAVHLPDSLEQYIHAVSVREPAVLARLREETSSYSNRNMQITAEQGQFMQFLVRATQAKHCLEIGVFTGYSSTWVALGLPEDGSLIACDVNEEWTSMARRYWREAGVEGKIDLRLAPALQTLDTLLAEGRAGSFDFAFIDADKPNYAGYWERCLQLIRRGGVIAVDNVLWSGKVANPAVDDAETNTMRAFNAKVHDDDRVLLSMLAIRDGLTLAYKK